MEQQTNTTSGASVVLGTTFIKRVLPALIRHSGKDDAQSHLRGIAVRACDGKATLVSTDGHRACLVRSDEAYNGVEFRIPLEAAKSILRIARATAKESEIDIRAAGIALVSGDGFDHSFQVSLPGTYDDQVVEYFPPVERLVRKAAAAPVGEMPIISTRYMSDALASFREANTEDRGGLYVHSTGLMEAVLVVHENVQDLAILIMPRRAEDLEGAVGRWKTAEVGAR